VSKVDRGCHDRHEVGAGSEYPDPSLSVVEAASLDQTVIGHHSPGGAPNICLDEERSEGVGCDVVFH
jgi:hypothetical protein